ncbi:MAG: cytochrome c3 family protein [Nitrospiraceae bacterium]|nr:cytochrome c3 family protein [Nitrospiraceae bacterium]
MNNHVLRPLLVVILLVVLVLIVRAFYVPKSFGVHQRGYMYGWYRDANVEDWKKFKVKYQGTDYCKDCHAKNHETIMMTPHAIIPCEDCHGPAVDHPSDPAKLTIDKSRELCLRCHYPLAYPTSGRANIRGVDPEKHNPGMECSLCHNPHKPGLEGLK